jgi:hypothetical protein
VAKEYDNNNQGVLFTQDPNKVRDAKTDPTHTGNAELDHIPAWLDGFRQADNAIKVVIRAKNDDAKEGEGVLKITGKDDHGPTYGGTCRFNDKMYDFSGKILRGKKDPTLRFLKLKFLPQQSDGQQPAPPENGAPSSEIPF